jgi:hypothetical protein
MIKGSWVFGCWCGAIPASLPLPVCLLPAVALMLSPFSFHPFPQATALADAAVEKATGELNAMRDAAALAQILHGQQLSDMQQAHATKVAAERVAAARQVGSILPHCSSPRIANA